MKTVQYMGHVDFELRGEREKEAADFLRDALTGVLKRRSYYIDTHLDAITDEVQEVYGVSINMKA